MSRVALTTSPLETQNIFNSIPQTATKEYAESVDKIDPLKRFRLEFSIPSAPNYSGRREAIYFTGFGLGLQPKRTLNNLREACIEWGKLGGLSYTDGKRPLRYCELKSTKLLLPIIGSTNIREVCLMNSCSVNANLLLTSFYKPTANRYKILIEKGAFCSDYHVIQGQFKLNNITKKDALIEIQPSTTNKYLFEDDDIIETINKHNKSISVIWLGVTQHLSGQLFDIATICAAAHKYNIYVGLDLSHGIGNVPLYLNKWGVDFAAFCGYKYLNGSGGAIGGIFVHEKHHNNNNLIKLRGWWGQDLIERYKFLPQYTPAVGAASWAISQTSLFSCVAMESSLEIFDEANFENLRIKSIFLTNYLQILIQKYLNKYIDIVSPLYTKQRGCQLSLATKMVNDDIDKLNKYLYSNGVICSTRKPNIIRVAPIPLYNTFIECWEFVQIIKKYYDKQSKL